MGSQPIFGPLRDKLGVITRAYFAQKDFDDKSILGDLASSFTTETNQTENSGVDEEGRMYMGELGHANATRRHPAHRG